MCGFCVPELGITPAGAGKTRQAQPSCLPRRDHPRRCGENVAALISILLLVRITPAGAGKTIVATESTDKITDHPRRCGENGIFLPLPISGLGSPPQVRGKRNASYHSARFGRITPAGAGKTLLFANFRAFQWDHPRRCGENSILLKLHVAAEGSPPQVRGKQFSGVARG